jgi:hypothetical protein
LLIHYLHRRRWTGYPHQQQHLLTPHQQLFATPASRLRPTVVSCPTTTTTSFALVRLVCV